MFIFWGTKTKEESPGVVGDFCPRCDRVREFTISDRLTAPHIYYVTIGGWTFHDRIKRCWDCGAEFYAKLKDYDDVLDEANAQRMSLRKIVRLTNTPLYEWMESQKQASRDAGERPRIERGDPND